MSHVVGPMTFQRETIQDCQEEIQPLLMADWREIAAYPDIALDPDWDTYRQIERMGVLRIYTVREDARLVGYAVFVVRAHLHYKGSVQATPDVLYLAPPLRKQMLGARFIQWCDEQLSAEGVQVVHQYVSREVDFGPLLKRLGYEPLGTIWARRLDRRSD